MVEVGFDPELQRLNFEVDLPAGSGFPHPKSGQDWAVYASEPCSWRHTNSPSEVTCLELLAALLTVCGIFFCNQAFDVLTICV